MATTEFQDMTVNCGKVMDINELQVELMSKEISGHYIDIVSTYFMEGSKKIEVTYYRNDEYEGVEIYQFANRYSNQHYYSRNYKWMVGVPHKYTDRINRLILAHETARENGYFRSK